MMNRQMAIQEKMLFYQMDPLGPETWMEDHIRIAVPNPFTGQPTWTYLGELPDIPHPITGKSYKEFWEWQKINIIRPSHVKNENGVYTFHTIALSTPRGQGKTFIIGFMILYRFLTMARQKILLGSNSVGQSKFSMYETLQELIRNSPKLLQIITPDNIKEKEIKLTNHRGETTNIIRTVSTSTGIMSNATAFNFTEFFQQRPDAPFFHQLNSSRRGIVNSMMYIDSTVSEEDHTLYKLYESSPTKNNTNPGVFFFYDYSADGDIKDYRNPSMTQAELDSFRDSMPPTEFRMLFLNRWNDGAGQLFKPEHIMAMRYVGVNGIEGDHQGMVETCRRIHELKMAEEDDGVDNTELINAFTMDLMPLSYQLQEDGHPRMATVTEVRALCDHYDSDCAILVGADRADPLKDDITLGARTIMTVTLKLLPGSRSNPSLHLSETKKDNSKVKYLYLNAALIHVATNELDDIKFYLDSVLDHYGRVDMLCSERWGMSELVKFCEDSEIEFELVSPTYAVQRSSFNTLYTLVRTGRLKSPPIAVPGYRKEDILVEELSSFRHDSKKKWYGSPTKASNNKPQDDSVFAEALGIYGGRELTPDDFEPVQQHSIFQGWFPEKTIGNY